MTFNILHFVYIFYLFFISEETRRIDYDLMRMAFNESQTDAAAVYYANYDNKLAVNVKFDFDRKIWRDRKGHQLPAYAWNETTNAETERLLQTGVAQPKESLI